MPRNANPHHYTHLQLARKYFSYYFNASSSKGHGIHSPFVFNFIKFVLNDKLNYDAYDKIEYYRKGLLNNRDILAAEDYGAGSATLKEKRSVAAIASTSLKSRKYSQLLHRSIRYFKPKNIVELGTSFGITTSYLATGNPDSIVYTLEGSSAIAAVAKGIFNKLALNNIRLIEGNFENTFPKLLSEIDKVDFAFIDGNHRKKSTLEYFLKLLHHATPSTIMVFDDIHWSPEMEDAWVEIQEHPAVTLTIDLFFLGFVIISPDFKFRQHFSIRF